jgi:hypothetical protein
MDYVTLPLGDEAEQQGPTAPPSNEDIVPAAVPQYQPRPPATAPATAFPSLQDYSQGGGVPQFEITVSEPQKQGNGYQAFICYKVLLRIHLYQLLFSPPSVLADSGRHLSATSLLCRAAAPCVARLVDLISHPNRCAAVLRFSSIHRQTRR